MFGGDESRAGCVVLVDFAITPAGHQSVSRAFLVLCELLVPFECIAKPGNEDIGKSERDGSDTGVDCAAVIAFAFVSTTVVIVSATVVVLCELLLPFGGMAGAGNVDSETSDGGQQCENTP
jgi:hypothetical protein